MKTLFISESIIKERIGDLSTAEFANRAHVEILQYLYEIFWTDLPKDDNSKDYAPRVIGWLANNHLITFNREVSYNGKDGSIIEIPISDRIVKGLPMKFRLLFFNSRDICSAGFNSNYKGMPIIVICSRKKYSFEKFIKEIPNIFSKFSIPFKHEFIHYLDSLKWSDEFSKSKKRYTKGLEKNSYLNNKIELNAQFFEVATEIEKEVSENFNTYRNYIDKKYTPKSFVDLMGLKVHNKKEFIDVFVRQIKYNRKNKGEIGEMPDQVIKYFTKRASIFYDNFREKYENMVLKIQNNL